MDKFVKYLDQEYEDLSTEQVETAVDVIEQRYGNEFSISPEDVTLEQVYEEAVEVDIDGLDDTPIYADPNAGEGEHLCVTWGNLGDDRHAPEGRAQNGEGDDLFGIR